MSHMRNGTARVEVRASVFCTVREPALQPLCGFHAAAFTRLLRLFDLPGHTEVVTCRGMGAPTCMLRVAVLNVPDSQVVST